MVECKRKDTEVHCKEDYNHLPTTMQHALKCYRKTECVMLFYGHFKHTTVVSMSIGSFYSSPLFNVACEDNTKILNVILCTYVQCMFFLFTCFCKIENVAFSYKLTQDCLLSRDSQHVCT